MSSPEYGVTRLQRGAHLHLWYSISVSLSLSLSRTRATVLTRSFPLTKTLSHVYIPRGTRHVPSICDALHAAMSFRFSPSSRIDEDTAGAPLFHLFLVYPTKFLIYFSPRWRTIPRQQGNQDPLALHFNVRHIWDTCAPFLPKLPSHEINRGLRVKLMLCFFYVHILPFSLTLKSLALMIIENVVWKFFFIVVCSEDVNVNSQVF